MSEAAAAVAPQPVSAQVVGNAFVQQYYHILHHSPAIVHKFYQDKSKLGRPEADGSMSVTTTMKAINEKILSLNYVDFRAEIKSVDTQESFNGGVQVLVTGYLTGMDNVIRNFSQCFFLAPQDPGYFVLNDIFRYLESSDLQDVTQVSVNDVVAPVTQEQIQENHVSDESSQVDEVTKGKVVSPPEYGDVPTLEEEVQVPELVEEIQNDSQPVVESDSKEEDVQKKSYASIVMHLKGSPMPFSSPAPALRKPPQKSQEHETNPPPAQETNRQIPSSDSSDNGNNQKDEAGYSIYLKGLPMTATVSLLDNTFKQFGPIRSGGIQVRSNRQDGFCFGFVEFEVPSAVEKALEASPISICGCQVVVEEKRSTNGRWSNNRAARFQSGGRGGLGFRNEGMRGRGSYGGGGGGGGSRGGYYRGDSNGRDEFNSSRGGGGGNKGRPSSRGGDGGYQRVDKVRPSSGGGDVYQRVDINGGGGGRSNHHTGGGGGGRSNHHTGVGGGGGGGRSNHHTGGGGGGGMSNGVAKTMAPRITATA